MALRLKKAALIVVVAGLAMSLVAGKPQGDADAKAHVDVVGLNGACFVCHMTFIKEPLVKVHQEHEVGCVKCHGLSAKHANDENIGASKPDVVYARDAVDAMCRECHKAHDVPAKKVVARFTARKLPTTRPAICTDCHGMHKIDKAGAGK